MLPVRRKLEKDAGFGRLDTKQGPSFGSVQLQSDPMGVLYHEPHWAWFCSVSSFNIPTSVPVLCSRGAWLGWVEVFWMKRNV